MTKGFKDPCATVTPRGKSRSEENYESPRPAQCEKVERTGRRLSGSRHQAFPGHFRRLRHAQQLEQARSDVRQDAAFQLRSRGMRRHVQEMHEIGRMRRI